MMAIEDMIRQLLKKYYKGDLENGRCEDNSKRAGKAL